MSRRLTTEDIQVRFIVNGNSAKRELGELDSKAAQLRAEMKGLKRNTEEWIAKNNELTKIRQRQDELRKSIGLTGLTMKQLYQRAAELRRIKDHLTPGTEQFKKLDKELAQVNARLKQLKYGTQSSGLSIKKMANSFNQYAAMTTAAVAAVAGVVFSIKNLIDGNAKLSDSLADVRKTTGLTEEGVKSLSKSFKNIDTRSSRRELLDLARIAGKLGVEGQQNIYGFVKAADQINVALSEDLGGNVEETIRQVGKLVDIFKVQDEFGLEEGLLKVGSAINALGASSTANEQYLVEFAKRFGGIAPNAGMTIQDVLGLAATLDQLGQTSEVSTTVLGKLFVLLGKDVERFAEMTGMAVDDFRKLLEEDANEAMIRVLEAAQSTKGGLEGMAESLEALGVDGQRSVGVIGVLSNNIKILRQQQKLSNEEFKKGTSLTEEFNVKNNNLAANIEKLGKKVRSAFISSTLLDWLNKAVLGVTKWMEVPIAEQLEEQRLTVNKLSIELADYTLKLEDKKRILNELKGINPTIVEGIEAENLSYSKLNENLKKYNEHILNTIILKQKEEEIGDLVEKRNKARTDLALALDDLRGVMAKTVEEFYAKDEELGKKAEMISKNQFLTMEQRSQALMNLGIEFNKKISQAATVTDHLLDQVEEKQVKLNIGESLLNYQHAIKVADEIEEDIQDMQKDKEDFEELFFGNQKKRMGESEKIWKDHVAGQEKTVEQQIELLEKLYQQGEVSLEFRNKKMEELNALLLNGTEDTLTAIEKKVRDGKNKWGQTYEEWLKELKEGRIKKQLDDLIKESQDAMTNNILNAPEKEEIPLPMMEDEQNVEDESEYLIEIFKKTIDGRRTLLEAHYNAGIISHAEYIDQKKALDKEYEDTVIQSNQLIYEAIHFSLNGFAELFNVLGERFRGSMAIFKAFAIFQTMISTYQAAVEAYKSAATIPGVGAVLAPLAAAAAIAYGTAQVIKIEQMKLPQHFEGKYPVIGAKDNRKYYADYYGEPTTGMVYQPGMFLAGEREPEMIISGPDLKDPMIANYAQAIMDIKHGAMGGKYSSNSTIVNNNERVIEKTFTDPKLLGALDRLNNNLEKGITGKWVYSEFEEVQDKVNKIREDISI